MMVVRITGGLGNQMFQYAFARSLQARGQKVWIHWHGQRRQEQHNGWELDRVFKQPLSSKVPSVNRHPVVSASAWLLRKTARRRQSANIGFAPEFMNATSGYLDGYWQSEKYFTEIEETLRTDFHFQPLEGPKNDELARCIDSRPSVSIHIRRGDYLNIPGLGNACPPDYFRRALARVYEEEPELLPVVFSDDIPYCRELLADYNAVYVDWNQGADSWMDMALMSRCRHHIIANSSFSWWGAWLDANRDGLVLAPEKWFAEGARETNPDIIPERWCRV